MDFFSELLGKSIVSIAIANDDRIVRVQFSDTYALYAILFPVRGNLLIHDPASGITEQFKRGALPTDPTTKRYDNTLITPTRDEITEAFVRCSGKNANDVLKSVRPWLQGVLAREILHRAQLSGKADAELFSETDIHDVCDTVETVFEDVAQNLCHVYMSDRDPLHVALVELHHLTDCEHIVLDDLLAGLYFFLRKRWSNEDMTTMRDRVDRAIVRELERLERSLTRLSNDATLRGEAARLEKLGNLLMIHLYEQPSGPGRIVVPDIFTDPRLMIEIPLKHGSTVLENAQWYFDKARQVKASRSHVNERRTMLTRRLDSLRALRYRTTHASSPSELRDIFKTHASLLRRLGLTDKGTREEAPFPFRRFVVAGGFEVWAGRNSANNDELTVRYARPNDIWFHARGVGGSHVVLRVGSAPGKPSKEAIQQAASIAAWYSKHRKAKHVPVAYTEKKYVRKPKGAAPGTVRMEREKVIFAQPQLPEQRDEEDFE